MTTTTASTHHIAEEILKLLDEMSKKQLSFLYQQFKEVLAGKRRHRLHKQFVSQTSSDWQRVFHNGYKQYMNHFFKQESNTCVPNRLTFAYSYDETLLKATMAEILKRLNRMTGAEVTAEFSTLDEGTVSTTNCRVTATPPKGAKPEELLLWKLTKYAPLQYHQSTEFGRRFTSGISLQNASKAVRRRLLRGTNQCDIDMKNAHPTLLISYLKLLHIDIPFDLQYYVENREAIISQYPDTDIKHAVLLSTYGAGIKTIETECGIKDIEEVPFLNNFLNMMKQLRVKLQQMWGCETHETSSILSLELQKMENRHLEEMENWCHLNNKNVGVLMFDGMITDNITDEECEKMEAFANNKTGHNIKLVVKERFYATQK